MGPARRRVQRNEQIDAAFERTIEEGEFRLGRTWPGLVATGLVGGADVTLGVFALLVVKKETGSDVLASLAFTIGFVALTLANSELFTENFLVPVAAVAARRAPAPGLLRLWGVTLAMNLVGAWLVMGLVISGFPHLGSGAVTLARHYVHIGVGWRSMAGALLGGACVTLMTWMERSNEAAVAKIVAAVVVGFLLAVGPLNHIIVVSAEMFGGLQHGAQYGYRDWAGIAAWCTLGNLMGGVGLVASLRLVQVGRQKIEQESRSG